ncbi:hypothetical protein I3843_08G111600 [Carya illinoinensis]|uniref:Uncharacterized protein n=1 Tax=Carya illinoinensis TaxID=32201 RepID=A0A8T1PM24_CARIL|nr:uncharacterized protein LOC122318487 [Carya illinoinensis]KAG6645336.1 hypothetical protein CIPAW_08G115600 [Carya illinoinensis]KAG6700509.1 hypothetical protein I3842_08G115700 [Carya illinoinensis]KAG7967689.1 hypothetical protein I3843_08G111600 [Carya illinoinensis]
MIAGSSMGLDSIVLEDQEVKLEDGAERAKNRKRKLNKTVDNAHAIPEKLVKRIILSLTKPSSVLGLGPKTGSKIVRWENRVRLCYLLRKLTRQHNWIELGGVLSMFLKGTCKDRSPANNRLKYSVSMELLKYMKSDRINPSRIKNIYDVWMRKNGSMKDCPIEDKFVVHLEFILFCLMHDNIEEAHQAALCLKQERELGSNPISNMVLGLTFYQLWYSTIPKEIQLGDSDPFYSLGRSDMLGTRFINSVGNSEWDNGNDTYKADIPFRRDSETSVMNDKQIFGDADINQSREVSMDVDVGLQGENHMQNFQPQDFSMNSDENTGNETSFSNHGHYMQYASNLSALRGMNTCLLPLQLPNPTENPEDFINLHRKMLNDYHMDAVKYFQQALHSTPPLLGALLPLIQLLLIGGQVDEALNELEKLCSHSIDPLPIRLKTSLLEHFNSNNTVVLSACFEDILKKDPTCSHSLAKLVRMHQSGDYGLESLLEMIALHLDATYAEYNTWKEFASCFIKLSQYEEDRLSVCQSENEDMQGQPDSIHFSKTPRIFTEGQSGKSWRLRCRWWLTRHFSNSILVSEIAAGYLSLLTYKAACATHLYGQEFGYVVEAYNCLEKQNERDLFIFLQNHMQNSIGIYSNTNSRAELIQHILKLSLQK